MNINKDKFDKTAIVIFIVIWFSGIAFAQGFWSTLFSLFPPYGIYLFVEKMWILLGVVT